MAGPVDHPIFARVFARLARGMEKEIGPYRDELLTGLRGHVVEVGAGNGMNFAHYPAAVERVTAVEPERYLRAEAQKAATPAVTVVDGTAEALPCPDDSADAVVFSLVLCSVEDPAAVLAEAGRVLRPGGELRFLEHVRASGRRLARAQRLADGSGLWPRVGGNCHCARDTGAAIAAAGFTIERSRAFDLGLPFDITRPHIVGRATA